MNTVALVGRLARAPTVRFEGAGIQVASATLMIVEPGKGKDFVLYVPVRFYGRSAEQASVLDAGALVAIQGKLAWTKTTKAGKETSTLCVWAQHVELLDAVDVASG